MTTSQRFCLRWNNHRSNLLTVFDELLQNQAFTDVSLVVENGEMIKCHKIVLAACSTYFQDLFHQLSSEYRSSEHPIIILKDVKHVEIKAILEYMYRGEVNVEQSQLNDLLNLAQVLKVKGLQIDEQPRDLRRENATTDTAVSPPPAISTSTGGGNCGSNNHSSPLHTTGHTPPPHYSSLYGSQERERNPCLLPLPVSWNPAASHQLPTSLSSSVLGSGSMSYDNGTIDTSFKRQKLIQSTSLLMNNDTPILRTVLGQAHVDSSQSTSLLQPDSHEPMHYRNASRSASDGDNRRNNDLVHSEAAHTANVSYMDEDERQTSPQSYGGDTVRNSAVADCVQPKPEWKRYKQYTRNDITQAIDAVRDGMSAVQAARKYGVPSRTLYDKVKKLGIPTSRPFKRSASNGGSRACFPYGIGANVNGTLYDNTGSSTNALSENETESGGNNINVAEGLAGTSTAIFEASTYAKAVKDTSQDRDLMLDSMARCSASPVISCTKRQQDLDDQVEDLSVSRKSDVSTFRRVIVPPSTTSAVIKEEAQEAGLDSNDS